MDIITVAFGDTCKLPGVKGFVEVQPQHARVPEEPGGPDEEQETHHEEHLSQRPPEPHHEEPHRRGGDDCHPIAEIHGPHEIARLPFEGEAAHGTSCIHAEQGGKHPALQAAGTPQFDDGGEAPETAGTARHGDFPSIVPSGQTILCGSRHSTSPKVILLAKSEAHMIDLLYEPENRVCQCANSCETDFASSSS
jgi:hypothetical protein